MGFLSEWQAFAVSQVMIMTTTLAITWFLVSPIAERRGWPRWVAVGIATPFVAAVGPVRETFEMGQVGWYLVGLCLLDVYALRSGRRWAGVGIGVAAAIKITPAFFVVYLLVTRQWRAAATAVGAAVAATLLGALLGPAMSWRFWTRTLWDTHRVGNIGSGRNSSVGGLIAHLTSAPGDPPHAIWLPAMVAVLTLGLWRAYRAHQAGDELAAFTITGVTTALLSPISWGHHLVWVVPGIILLVNAALPGERGLSWRPLLLAAAAYTLYVSGAMHHFNRHAGGHNWDGGWVDQLGANSYALGCLAMLAVVPIVERHAHRRPDVLDAELAALRQPQRVP
jgi:alpha-1,2-mannosyltransferase